MSQHLCEGNMILPQRLDTATAFACSCDVQRRTCTCLKAWSRHFFEMTVWVGIGAGGEDQSVILLHIMQGSLNAAGLSPLLHSCSIGLS